MKNISPYSSFLFESDNDEKMIPFLMRIDTSDYGCFNYWHVGIFPTFREFSEMILEEYGINSENHPTIEDGDQLITILDGERLDGSTKVVRVSTFWSDDLIISSDYNKRFSNFIEASNPFRMCKILKSYFPNVEEVIDKYGEGNSGSQNYLIESFKNRPADFENYNSDMLAKIIDLTGWDEKKKKSFLTLNKIKGMY